MMCRDWESAKSAEVVQGLGRQHDDQVEVLGVRVGAGADVGDQQSDGHDLDGGGGEEGGAQEARADDGLADDHEHPARRRQHHPARAHPSHARVESFASGVVSQIEMRG